MNTTLHETLLKTGMEPTTAEIYLTLVENGEMTVPRLLEKVPLSRATVYEALPTLLAEGFVEYRKEGRVAYYKPNHPTKLFTLMEEKKREVSLLEGEFKNMVQSLAGIYNLGINKPGVKYYEGLDGIKDALFTSLEAKNCIYTFMTIDPILEFAGDLNTEYVKKRKEKNIVKKMLVVETPKALERYAKNDITSTDVKFLPKDFSPFKTNIQIFDNSILFFTLTEKEQIGFEIMNPEIAGMFKNIFEFIWNAGIAPSNIKPNSTSQSSIV